MNKRFMHFRVPCARESWDDDRGSPLNDQLAHPWDPEIPFSLRAEARWSAFYASLKEEILEIFLGEDRSGTFEKAR